MNEGERKRTFREKKMKFGIRNSKFIKLQKVQVNQPHPKTFKLEKMQKPAIGFLQDTPKVEGHRNIKSERVKKCQVKISPPKADIATLASNKL